MEALFAHLAQQAFSKLLRMRREFIPSLFRIETKREHAHK